MRKVLLGFISSLMIIGAISAQSIVDVEAYSKSNSSHFVTLLSDQSIWWFNEKTGWQKVPNTGLPADATIKHFNSYLRMSLNKSTRLVVVLQDNSMWWYADGGSWERISDVGLPKGASIKIFRPYIKFNSKDSRFVAILDDNSMWWYANGEEWKQIPSEGLPAKKQIVHLGTYQKQAMMGTDTRYVVTVDDNSAWWYADNVKRWQRVESYGLPAKKKFKQLEAYTKISGSVVLTGYKLDGRLIGVLDDETIWWFAAEGSEWKKLDASGLPKDYKITAMKIYQKSAGLSGDTRVIVALQDNSIWWYADGKKEWNKVPMDGLMVSAGTK